MPGDRRQPPPRPPAEPICSALLVLGADGETRTHTAYATAPSRQRVYQFHHVGALGHFGTSMGFDSVSCDGAAGVAGAAPCGTSVALVSLSTGAGALCGAPCFITSAGP